jgi:hypothetical protein
MSQGKPEIALVAEARPLREDREREDPCIRERDRTSRTTPLLRVVLFPPFFYEHLQGDEQGFEVHGAPPFAEGDTR